MTFDDATGAALETTDEAGFTDDATATEEALTDEATVEEAFTDEAMVEEAFNEEARVEEAAWILPEVKRLPPPRVRYQLAFGSPRQSPTVTGV
jgi:hypothetical protein